MLKKIEKSLVAVMLIAAVMLNGSPMNATADTPGANAPGVVAEKTSADHGERKAIEPVTVLGPEGQETREEISETVETNPEETEAVSTETVEIGGMETISDDTEMIGEQADSKLSEEETESELLHPETQDTEMVFTETETTLTEEESETNDQETESSQHLQEETEAFPQFEEKGEETEEQKPSVILVPQESVETEVLSESGQDPEGESREARYRITFRNGNQGLGFTDLLGNYLSADEVLAGEDYRFCIDRDGDQLQAEVTVLDTYIDEYGVTQTRELLPTGEVYTITNVAEDHSIHLETRQVLNVQLPSEGVSLMEIEACMADGSEAGLSEIGSQVPNQKQYLVDEGAFVHLKLQVAEQYRDQSPVVLQGESPLIAQKGESPRVYVYDTNMGISRATTLAVQEVQKNTYKVILPAIEGGLIQEINGYNANAVVSGGSYQFKLTIEEDYQKSVPVVTANGKVLSSSDGVYTIFDITQDQKIEITGIQKSYYKVELPVQEGFYLLSQQGYEAGRIAYGEDYKFRLELKDGYEKSPVQVYVDGSVLGADENGVYTIADIKSDKKVTVKGIRRNLVIQVSASSVRVGEKLKVTVLNVPEGYQVNLHNCTPTKAILSKEGRLTGAKKGSVKLIATATKGKDKLEAVKRVKIKKAAKKKLRIEERSFQVDGINYKVMKAAGRKSKGSVVVANNQGNRNLEPDVRIPSVVSRKGRSYRVTGIEANAFYGVSSVRSVTIPKSVSNISSTAFVKCRNLIAFHVASGNSRYRGADNLLLSKDGKTLIAYPSAEGEVTIGGKITSIAPYALSATKITKLTVGSGVKQISVCAFSHTSLLRKVYLKNKNAQTIQCGCAFDHVNKNCLVYVPEESLDRYKEVISGDHGTKSLRYRELQE